MGSRTHLKLFLPIMPLQETVQEEKSMRYIIQHYLGQNHISKPQVLCRIQLNKQLSAILKLFQLGLWCKYNTMFAFEKDMNMSHSINPRLAFWNHVGQECRHTHCVNILKLMINIAQQWDVISEIRHLTHQATWPFKTLFPKPREVRSMTLGCIKIVIYRKELLLYCWKISSLSHLSSSLQGACHLWSSLFGCPSE